MSQSSPSRGDGRPPLRVAVVGGGLIAQAEHLPRLHRLDGRFEIAALVEPSPTVRDALARRYGIASTFADTAELLAAGGLDAAVVCAPAFAHADVVVSCLEAGLHVFCEKPLCITLADADRIIAARDRAQRVVQVGYMKRFDPAYEAMASELPASTDGLRYVSVVANDPEFGPYFDEGDVVRGADVPDALLQAGAKLEAEQVEQAVGLGDPASVRAFSDGYLGSLVHFVNLVHGLLERMGEPLPAPVAGSAWWAEGGAVTSAVRLAGGARWDSSWIQLLGLHEHRERVELFFEDSIRSLEFPSPWLDRAPTRYERSWAADGARVSHTVRSHREAFTSELVHFHDCIVSGIPCRTPPEQARVDIDALTQMFRAATQTTP
ncbi:MAG TPA: Gfo/Idh/MocA family oxidoreductase [Baekduia sp.]|nr:Gfo/Idh/MocA family oxidoreductase [Baekduia sp.]